VPGACSRPASRASGYARTPGILDKSTSAAGLMSTSKIPTESMGHS